MNKILRENKRQIFNAVLLVLFVYLLVISYGASKYKPESISELRDIGSWLNNWPKWLDLPLMDWINTMAYAMVAGVLMLMLVHPIGILAASELYDRLLGLVAGVGAMILTKRIIPSLLCGILMFAASLHLF